MGHNASPTIEMKAKFKRVVLVIFDEISMTDQGLLGNTECASKSLNGELSKLIGGKHVETGCNSHQFVEPHVSLY